MSDDKGKQLVGLVFSGCCGALLEGKCEHSLSFADKVKVFNHACEQIDNQEISQFSFPDGYYKGALNDAATALEIRMPIFDRDYLLEQLRRTYTIHFKRR